MAVHNLKVIPPYFDPLESGDKTFEYRLNDRGFQRGDRLLLWEYVPDRCKLHSASCSAVGCPAYTGRNVERVVSFVYTGDPRFGGIEHGYCVLALRPPAETVTPGA